MKNPALSKSRLSVLKRRQSLTKTRPAVQRNFCRNRGFPDRDSNKFDSQINLWLSSTEFAGNKGK